MATDRQTKRHARHLHRRSSWRRRFISARSIFAPLTFAHLHGRHRLAVAEGAGDKTPASRRIVADPLLTLAVVIAVSSMVTWALSVERQWLIGHAARFQTVYLEWARWLEDHEIFVVGPCPNGST